MTRHEVELRPARSADYEALVGEPCPITFRGVAGWKGDRLLGLGGVAYAPNGAPVAFMRTTDEGATHVRDIIRGAKAVLELMKSRHRIVYALPLEQEVAPRFLRHWGFRPVREDLYVWRRAG